MNVPARVVGDGIIQLLLRPIHSVFTCFILQLILGWDKFVLVQIQVK